MKQDRERTQTYTPEFTETEDGKFSCRLRYHLEGDPPDADVLYDIGIFETREAGYVAIMKYRREHLSTNT
jgi:hypothetical protein